MGGQGRLSPDWKRIHILKIKIQGDRQCSVKDLPVFLTDGGWTIDLEVMSRDTDKGVALKALDGARQGGEAAVISELEREIAIWEEAETWL